jgi:hypothetical protein
VGVFAGLDTEARGKIPYLCRGSNPIRPVCVSSIHLIFSQNTELRFILICPIIYFLFISGLPSKRYSKDVPPEILHALLASPTNFTHSLFNYTTQR